MGLGKARQLGWALLSNRQCVLQKKMAAMREVGAGDTSFINYITKSAMNWLWFWAA
jgi:hypothetical protein